MPNDAARANWGTPPIYIVTCIGADGLFHGHSNPGRLEIDLIDMPSLVSALPNRCRLPRPRRCRGQDHGDEAASGRVAGPAGAPAKAQEREETAPPAFVPTEKIDVEQAVAFPYDI